MACGQYSGGAELWKCRSGLVHAMAHQLGGTYNLPHGLCNAILLPWVMEFNLEAAEKPYAEIAWLWDEAGCRGMTSREKLFMQWN